MIENWKEDVLKEKSLQEVYLVSRNLPKSTFNRIAYVVVAAVIISIGAKWIVSENVTTSAKVALEMAGIGFDLTVQILGFLIGGFAIFATVTDPRLMKRLAQARMPDCELSVFKTVFFNFLSVFYVYVVTLAACLIVRVGADVNAIRPETIFNQSSAAFVVTAVNSLVFAVLAFLCSMAVVRLKSFIWNIYQAFLTFLAVSEMMDKEDEDRRAAQVAHQPQSGAQ